jgi:hypothetical protein
MNKSFFNPATWREKAEELRNRQRLREPPAPSCYHQMARHGVDLTLTGEGSPAGYVAGSEPFVRYPASGYSGGPQPGLEPPLGVEIDQQEPTGTFAEVQRSLEEFASKETAGLAGCSNASRADASILARDRAPAEVSPAAEEVATSSTAPARSSSPSARLPGDVATLDRLAALMAGGLVRPVVRRRKL